jgi:hypothetical protein
VNVFLPCWMPCRWRNDASVSSPTGPNTSPAPRAFPRPVGCTFHLLPNRKNPLRTCLQLQRNSTKGKSSAQKLKRH